MVFSSLRILYVRKKKNVTQKGNTRIHCHAASEKQMSLDHNLLFFFNYSESHSAEFN